jgi:hypothetical protein
MRTSRRSTRRGLAPLELVMALPIFMMVMALMVNYATSTCWKVRTMTAARQGIYRARDGWRGGGDLHLPDWPSNGRLNRAGAGTLRTVNGAWLRPEIDKPFLKGPMIVNEGPYPTGNAGGISVYPREPLEMPNGLSSGTADLTREMPFLKNLRGGGVGGRQGRDLGQFVYSLRHVLLENRWQFFNMGYGWNHDRRLKGWYNFETNGAWSQQQARFQQADASLVGYGAREQLVVLDRDPELMNFRQTQNYGCFPGAQGQCSLDAVTFRQLNLPQTVDRIQGPRGRGQEGVPECLANQFLDMYRQQLRDLMALQNPPQSEIARLQQLIQQLEQFLGSLG